MVRSEGLLFMVVLCLLQLLLVWYLLVFVLSVSLFFLVNSPFCGVLYTWCLPAVFLFDSLDLKYSGFYSMAFCAYLCLVAADSNLFLRA